MASEESPRSGERLPIKLIMPNQGIERPVMGVAAQANRFGTWTWLTASGWTSKSRR